MNKPATQAEEGIDNPLLGELTRRGITVSQAKKLLSSLEPGQQVIDQLEWGDYIVSQGAIKNPPGLYVTFVRENMTPPDSFESSRKRRLKQEQAQAASGEQLEEDALLLEYGEYRNKEIDQYIANNPERYEHLRLTKVEDARVKFDGFAEWKPELADKFVTTLARAEVAKGIPFDTFETFRRRRIPQAIPQLLLALPAPAPTPEQGSDAPASAGEDYIVV